MFKDNLISLRRANGLSQDELAEKIGVTRQTLSKYETGESLPDIERCKQLADIFGVSMDDLVNYEKTDRENMGLEVPPKGKHVFGMVKVGDKGQIVIPANARKIFDIQPGDNLLILGDEEQGLAILKEKKFLEQLRLMEQMRHMGSGELSTAAEMLSQKKLPLKSSSKNAVLPLESSIDSTAFCSLPPDFYSLPLPSWCIRAFYAIVFSEGGGTT